jgi:hypothetical protein
MSLDTEAKHHWVWQLQPGHVPGQVTPILDTVLPPKTPVDGTYVGDGFLRQGDGTIVGEVSPGMSQHIEDNLYANALGNSPYNRATFVEDWNTLEAWSFLIRAGMGPNFRTARYDPGEPPPVPGDGSFNDLQTVYNGSLVGDAISTGSGTVGWAIEKRFLNQLRLVMYHQNLNMQLGFGDGDAGFLAFTVDPGKGQPVYFQSLQDNNINHVPFTDLVGTPVWWTSIPPPTTLDFHFKGQWTPLTTYAKDDIVFTPYKGTWHHDQVYSAGDIVRQLARYYISMQDLNDNHEPLNGVNDPGWWAAVPNYSAPVPTIVTYKSGAITLTDFVGLDVADAKEQGDSDWLGSSGSNAGMNVAYRNNSGTNDNGGANPWTGFWSDIYVWDKVLTPEELFTQTPLLFGVFAKKIKKRFRAVQAAPHVLFSHALEIVGAIGHTPAWDVAGLYTEPGEPAGSAVIDGVFQTAWFKWVAPVSGSITFFTADSTPADDYSQSPSESTKLWCTATVWTGSSLAGLTEVDSSNDSATTPLWFDAIEGTTYYFQIGTGQQNENGTVALSWG